MRCFGNLTRARLQFARADEMITLPKSAIFASPERSDLAPENHCGRAGLDGTAVVESIIGALGGTTVVSTGAIGAVMPAAPGEGAGVAKLLCGTRRFLTGRVE
jgi:hypothetical protein